MIRLKQFLNAIGVTTVKLAVPPLWDYRPNQAYDPKVDQLSPGYLKFMSTDSSTDTEQANQFETWLKKEGYEYQRGYYGQEYYGEKDGPETDRRFFLAKPVAHLIETLVVKYGSEVVEAD